MPNGSLLLTPAQDQMFCDVQSTVIEDYERPKKYDRGLTYPYIRLYEDGFIKAVVPHLKPGMSVVDVGCGAGDKLLMFHKIEPTLKITGIEHHPTMAAFARYVAPFANIVTGDAFEQDYKLFDLVYMYCPISHYPLQARLQECVMDKMSSGAVLVVKLYARRYFDVTDVSTSREFPDLEKGWRKP